ncbi:hypothetical protein CF65_01896 [Aggregatibacter actinomycetemcomitans HK1651]|nr:hypothetical protein CF65_01896 [Aggregatibacter actinomycetemcomitans HK1651]
MNKNDIVYSLPSFLPSPEENAIKNVQQAKYQYQIFSTLHGP